MVKAGLFGPRLTTLVAFMKGVCHASFSTIRKFLRDVVRVHVSRGYLAKLIAKASESLAAAYAELFSRLPDEVLIGVGKADCVRPPLPPNRTGGFPASGSPVNGFTSERID